MVAWFWEGYGRLMVLRGLMGSEGIRPCSELLRSAAGVLEDWS